MDLDEVLVAGAANIGSPELSYETEQDKAIRLGKATDLEINTRPTGGNNEATPMNGIHEDDIINIQLPYDPQAPTEPELWSGSFHPISLHGSIEHLASDTKNVKASLNILAKYIQGKRVDGNKVNDLKILTVWVTPSGISYLQYTLLNGTRYTPIKKLTPSGQKSRRNLPHTFPLQKAILRTSPLNRFR